MATQDQPVDIKIDLVTRELVLVGGDVVWTTGVDAVAQAVFLAVTTHMGEVFYDLTEGLPYFQRDGVLASAALIGSKFDERKVTASFMKVIRTVPNVQDVEGLTVSFDRKTRVLSITWACRTTFGDTFTGFATL